MVPNTFVHFFGGSQNENLMSPMSICTFAIITERFFGFGLSINFRLHGLNTHFRSGSMASVGDFSKPNNKR